MSKKLFCIRGAVCAQNSVESITENVALMCSEIFSKNNIKAEDLVNITFSMTPDLDVLNPATALRKSDVGIDTSKVALMCFQEAVIKNMLPNVIRVMVSAYLDEDTKVATVYLNGAQALRPDVHGKA